MMENQTNLEEMMKMKKSIYVLVFVVLFVSMARPVMAAESDTYVTMSIYVSDEGYTTLSGEYHGQEGMQNAVALALDGELLILKPSTEKLVMVEVVQHLSDGRHTNSVWV